MAKIKKKDVPGKERLTAKEIKNMVESRSALVKVRQKGWPKEFVIIKSTVTYLGQPVYLAVPR